MDQLFEEFFGEVIDKEKGKIDAIVRNGFSKIIEKKTHTNLAHVNHEFIHVSDMDKLQPLNLLIKEFKTFQNKKKKDSSCVIFCNSVSSARAINHALTNQGLKTSNMHGDIPSVLRAKEFQDFKDQKTEVLVATDLASRGLDFPFVSHVINFDFPKTVSDYLHRAGRTGRAGREGQVLSLYRNKDLGILEQMKASYDSQEPLKINNSAYTQKPGKEEKVTLGQNRERKDPEYQTTSLTLKEAIKRKASEGIIKNSKKKP